jgi:hypothetical protein
MKSWSLGKGFEEGLLYGVCNSFFELRPIARLTDHGVFEDFDVELPERRDEICFDGWGVWGGVSTQRLERCLKAVEMLRTKEEVAEAIRLLDEEGIRLDNYHIHQIESETRLPPELKTDEDHQDAVSSLEEWVSDEREWARWQVFREAILEATARKGYLIYIGT